VSVGASSGLRSGCADPCMKLNERSDPSLASLRLRCQDPSERERRSKKNRSA
jgi:hypothetical protein